jgi:hypothetical protein
MQHEMQHGTALWRWTLIMDERRSEYRQRVLKGASIVFNKGRSTITCTVRELSPGGARLRIPNSIGVPDQFTLVLSDGARWEARVVWRLLNEMGVAWIE